MDPIGTPLSTATAQTIATATATVATMVGRSSPRTVPHRAMNVHGLMYGQGVVNDFWINAVLSTLAMSCAACICLCFLYCKLQQWRLAAQRRREEKNSQSFDIESLPSYTIVTGLPTYDEALERMKGSQLQQSLPPPPWVPAKSSVKPHSIKSCVAVSEVRIKNEVGSKCGLVSHTVYEHNGACSNCLSVQELLETYNVGR